MFKQACDCDPVFPESLDGFPDFGHIKLEGIANCRDLGGFPVEDGRRIKPGRLIRSAALHKATSSDMHILTKEHDLRRVVDFRTAFEIGRQEDPFPEMQDIDYINLRPISDERELSGGEKDAIDAIRRLADDTPGVFREMYADMITDADAKKAFSLFLETLLEADTGATLWHCTQGKDRTGIAAMLVESALGATDEAIRADYLATNLFAKTQNKDLDAILRKIPMIGELNIDLDAATYAQSGNIDTALTLIKEMHGSVGAYMALELDFGADKCERLKELYLD